MPRSKRSLRDIARDVRGEYRRFSKWVMPSVFVVWVLAIAVWVTYFAAGRGYLNRAEFSPFNADGFLRNVLIWFLLLALAVLPLFFAADVLVRWLLQRRGPKEDARS